MGWPREEGNQHEIKADRRSKMLAGDWQECMFWLQI